MKVFNSLVKRNVKMFFKDKGLFFTSLITPLILLVLYATFLSNVYRDSLSSIFTEMGVTLPKEVINGAVGGQLLSSLLSVSCITVSFCSNMLMVQDKVSGARKDMLMSPVKRSTMALSYYFATTFSTLIICFTALLAGLIYIAIIGWYLSLLDVLLLIIDVLVLVTLGTALSSVINYFLSTQGQISAVGSIVSSCYGFISGAYMPLSSFSQGLRNVLMFSPGTYGTSLLRKHSLNGVIKEMNYLNLPEQAVKGFKDAVDCNVYFFGEQFSSVTSFLVLLFAVALFIGLYDLFNIRSKKNN